MPRNPDLSRAEADRLYGLPLDEFTGERDAAARELRKAGDREAARAVGKLRKPTVAAWAVNQLARRHGDDMDALLEAGEDLRAAHEQLLAGKGGDAVGQAAAAERAAVGKLLRRARRLDLSPAALERVAETLQAVAGSEELREELSRGAVTRERQAAGFGGLDLGSAAAGATAARPRAKQRPKAKPKPKPRDDRPRLLKAARAELRKLRRAHGSAGRALEAAERRLSQARDQVAEREARADAARAQEADAQRRLADAEEEVRRLEG